MRHRLPLALVSLVLAAGPVAAHEHEPAASDAPDPAVVAPAEAAAPATDPAASGSTIALGDAAALKAKLEASADDAMMGATMESHAKELVALLQQWGDAPFADVLGTCSPEAITSTQGLLEYAGASRAKYRQTFAVEP